MSMVCISLRCCLDGLVLCTSRAFCEDCVRSEADCCVVATLLMCLPVAQVRPSRYERLAMSGRVGAECTSGHQYFWSAWMQSGVSGSRSSLWAESDSEEAFAVVGCLSLGSCRLRAWSAGSLEQAVAWL